MKPVYCHLDLAERRKIQRWRDAKVSVEIIAEKLNRHRSTIFRELRRNHYHDAEIPKISGYYCVPANDMAQERRAVQRKLVKHPELREAIIGRIKAGWSPEQIAGRLKLEGQILRVCHETIYRYIYSKEMQEAELWRDLAERRRKRRPRHARRKLGRRFGPEVSILMRPDVVARREQFGHWECDLIQFRKRFGNGNLTSLVERVSRFTVLQKNNDRKSRPIMNNLINVLSALPFEARRSITFDRGTEFTEWPYLQAGIGTETWFCDPQSPWQKGTVENTNRRARKWLPREVDPASISNHHLKMICDRLNSTPRKCLGWRTPAEVFREKVLDDAA